MAGQGTLGLEIVGRYLPEVTDVFVSIGGGGFISGIAHSRESVEAFLSNLGRGNRRRGRHGASISRRSSRSPAPPSLPSREPSVPPSVSDMTLAITQKYVESVTVVSDAEAARALRFLLERTKVLTEPAASCTLAASGSPARSIHVTFENSFGAVWKATVAVDDLMFLRYLTCWKRKPSRLETQTQPFGNANPAVRPIA